MPATEKLPMADTLQARFLAFLAEHERIVFKVANTYCTNAEDRRDLVQEISAQLWRAFPRYDEARSFSTWAYRIALNVAISYARREGVRQTVSLVAEHPAVEQPGCDDRIEALRRFMTQLDELNRALLLLYLDEHSYREIAEILGITETNVASKINRLKDRIRGDAAFKLDR
jgi:RNA polymerase sigma-70 factor (ECF subfamily)